MDIALLSLAFTSGILIFFTPCGVALLPAYVTYIIGREDQQQLSVAQKAWAGFKVGLVVSAGILAVFVGAGVLVSSLGNVLAPFAKHIAIVVGGLLVLLGLFMLAGKTISVNIPHSLAADKKSTWRFFMFGVGYALGGIGCTLPAFLFIIFSAISSGSFISAFTIFLAFAAGTVLLMLLVTTLSAVSQVLISRLIAQYMPIINRVAGFVVVVAGAYLIAFQFGVSVQTVFQSPGDEVSVQAPFIVYAGTDHSVTLLNKGSVRLQPQSIERSPEVELVNYRWTVAQAPVAAGYKAGEVIVDGKNIEPFGISFGNGDVGIWRFNLEVTDSNGNKVEDDFRVHVQDKIESLEKVQSVPAAVRADLSHDAEVLGVVVGDLAMAYPRETMNYHGIANDVVGDTPVAVVYCDSCATGLVYDRRVGDTAITFKGLGGTLSEDNYTAIDKENKSMWSIIDGQAVDGPHKGSTLEFVNFEQTSWGDWLKKHPKTRVMRAMQ